MIDALSPLTKEEVELSVDILRKEKNLDLHYRFITVRIAKNSCRESTLEKVGKILYNTYIIKEDCENFLWKK
jgi:Cu2+-containing amine oxidase